MHGCRAAWLQLLGMVMAPPAAGAQQSPGRVAAVERRACCCRGSDLCSWDVEHVQCSLQLLGAAAWRRGRVVMHTAHPPRPLPPPWPGRRGALGTCCIRCGHALYRGAGVERTWNFKQEEIVKVVDTSAARKAFDLNLTELGPYSLDFTRSGRYMLMGGMRGHIALMDWQRSALVTEVQVRETTRDVKFLHNETFFAAAQKKYVYIYDKRGLEVHCLRDHVEASVLEFLPHHFLLSSIGDAGARRTEGSWAASELRWEHARRSCASGWIALFAFGLGDHLSAHAAHDAHADQGLCRPAWACGAAPIPSLHTCACSCSCSCCGPPRMVPPGTAQACCTTRTPARAPSWRSTRPSWGPARSCARTRTTRCCAWATRAAR